MRALPTLAAASIAACTADARPLGQVSVALGADVCADFCIAAMRATLYADGDRVLPLGPALQVECGAALTFDALPAGERVVVSVEAFDVIGDRLLVGDSEAITVVADDVARATVKLSAESSPEITAVTPDPVAAGAALTVRGAFDAALGEAAVELDGAALDGWSWTVGDASDAIAVTLPVDAAGGALVVRRCGVASAPWDLRVYGAALGEAEVGAPPCGDALALAATADGDDVLVAWRCDGGRGAVTHLRSGDALCPLDPGLGWSLERAPTAVALRDGRAYAAGDDGVWSFDIASAAAPTRLFAGSISGLAYAGTTLYAVDVGRLVTAGGAVAGIDAGLDVGPLGADGATLYAAAATADGEGRLVIVGAGPPSAVSLVDGARVCRRPVALAVAAPRVGLACADGDVVVWDGGALAWLEVPAVSTLAFDDRGDVLYAHDASGLVLLGVPGAAPRLPHAPGEHPLLVALGEHRLLMSGVDRLVVATPYSPAGPCAEAAP